MDELVWISIDKLKKKYNNLKISTKFPELDSKLLIANINPNEVLVGITNLLDNAIKYSFDETVDVSFSNEDGSLKLVIQDYGRGIDEHDLDNILKPFYRSPEVKNISGNGLGLTLSNQLFLKNGISMLIESKKNEGTTISLIFRKSE